MLWTISSDAEPDQKCALVISQLGPQFLKGVKFADKTENQQEMSIADKFLEGKTACCWGTKYIFKSKMKTRCIGRSAATMKKGSL